MVTLVMWPGCNAILGIKSLREDICAWISEDNCYLDFHKSVQDACAAPGANGAFQTRAMLDTCIIAQGGSVKFDPPLDPAQLPLPTPLGDAGPGGIKMTFVNPFGM